MTEWKCYFKNSKPTVSPCEVKVALHENVTSDSSSLNDVVATVLRKFSLLESQLPQSYSLRNAYGQVCMTAAHLHYGKANTDGERTKKKKKKHLLTHCWLAWSELCSCDQIRFMFLLIVNDQTYSGFISIRWSCVRVKVAKKILLWLFDILWNAR